MVRQLTFFTVWLLSGMVGCSEQGEQTGAADASGEPQHVWKEQVRALEKAEGVEQTIMDARERRAAERDQQ